MQKVTNFYRLRHLVTILLLLVTIVKFMCKTQNNNMEDVEKKYVRTTQTQLDWYVDFVKDNPEMVTVKKRDLQYQSQIWLQIAKNLNQLPGPRRCALSWKSSLRNWMKQLRSRARKQHAQTGGTGNPYTGDHLSEFEQRTLEIFGSPTIDIANEMNILYNCTKVKMELEQTSSPALATRSPSPCLSFEAKSPALKAQLEFNEHNYIDEFAFEESTNPISLPAKSANFDPDAIQATLKSMENRISSLEANYQDFQVVVTETLNKILEQTTRIDKFIGCFINEKTKKSTKKIDVAENNALMENFDDLQKMLPIRTTQQLEAFEQKLLDDAYQNRFMRFLKTKYTMNGYVNGGTLFNQVIRFLTDPDLFLAYTWKGFRRNGVEQTSFQMKHKVFVELLYRIIRLADATKTNQNVDEYFAIIFRFKIQEATRRHQQLLPHKLPTKRNRLSKPTLITAPAEDTDNNIELVICE